MKLRGHHVFCTALFSGHGYNEAFTEKMRAIISNWKTGEAAILSAEPDEVCSACPNHQADGGCKLGTENVLYRDNSALRVLRLNSGDRLTWKQAGTLLSEITEQDFQAVCGDCMWQREGLCSFELLKKSVGSEI